MPFFDRPKPHLFAHRGGNVAGEKTENSLEAFGSAVKMGYVFLETDVIVTRDGAVITYHGSQNLFMKMIFDLEVRRKAQKLTYKELNDKAVAKGRRQIPKFDEVLKKFPDQAFCVDVKTDEVVEPLVELLIKHQAQNRVVITTFSKKRSKRANKLLYGDNFNRACLCVYRMKGYLIKTFPAVAIKYLKKQGFSYLHIPYKCVNQGLVRDAEKMNFNLYAWTVNDIQAINKLLDYKIQGIISDESELLLRAFNEHKNSKN